MVMLCDRELTLSLKSLSRHCTNVKYCSTRRKHNKDAKILLIVITTTKMQCHGNNN